MSANALNLDNSKFLSFWKELTVYQLQSQILTVLCKNPPENIVGKEENAGNQHYSFSHNDSTHQKYNGLHFS